MTAGRSPESPSHGPDRGEPRPGGLRTLGPGPLVIALAIGLVGGWSIRLVARALERPAPIVGWTQAFALFFVAAALVGTAWITRRAVAEPVRRPEPHQLVNRLVLARACALVGAVVAGGYAGYALSWVGAGAELADVRAIRSLISAAGGASVTGAAICVERACRVPPGDKEE